MGHNQETHLTFETFDYSGEQTEQFTQWGRSFLLQYYLFTSSVQNTAYGTGAGVIAIKDTANVARSIPIATSASSALMCIAAPVATTTYGLVVGTDTTANTATQVALNTLIANGVGAGQLSYGVTALSSASGSTPCQYTMARNLANGSAAPIIVNEAGVYFSGAYAGPTQDYWAIIRDVNSGGLVTINNGSNTTGTYTLSYTIS